MLNIKRDILYKNIFNYIESEHKSQFFFIAQNIYPSSNLKLRCLARQKIILSLRNYCP